MNKSIASFSMTNNDFKLRSRMKAGTQKPFDGRSASIFKMDLIECNLVMCHHPGADLNI